MDRIVKDLHLGPRSAISRAFKGLRQHGYIVLGDASRASLYWVNGNRLTACQLVALAVMRGMPVKERCRSDWKSRPTTPYDARSAAQTGAIAMKAVLGNHIVAQSNDITEAHGYSYFPSSSVRLDWLEKAPKTADDLKCPHGVQFYDLIVDGKRHARAAWSYEKPQPKMQHVGGRFGFWGDVTVS